MRFAPSFLCGMLRRVRGEFELNRISFSLRVNAIAFYLIPDRRRGLLLMQSSCFALRLIQFALIPPDVTTFVSIFLWMFSSQFARHDRCLWSCRIFAVSRDVITSWVGSLDREGVNLLHLMEDCDRLVSRHVASERNDSKSRLKISTERSDREKDRARTWHEERKLSNEDTQFILCVYKIPE